MKKPAFFVQVSCTKMGTPAAGVNGILKLEQLSFVMEWVTVVHGPDGDVPQRDVILPNWPELLLRKVKLKIVGNPFEVPN